MAQTYQDTCIGPTMRADNRLRPALGDVVRRSARRSGRPADPAWIEAMTTDRRHFTDPAAKVTLTTEIVH
jgi:hypothetical protein